MKKPGFIIIWIAVLASCSNMKMSNQASYPTPQYTEVIEKSLFDSPESTISEENIKKLLDGKIIIGDSLRIALFNYSFYSRTNYYYYNDEELLKTQQSYIDSLIGGIKLSKKVEKVFVMPSIMANQNSTIINLRETAVRLQADLLLVYSIKSDIYYKYKAFSADETKAFATVETFLMDTKTGVIPFTTIVTKESFMKKTGNELSVEELRKKAEKDAVIQSLTEIGQQVNVFLEK